MKSHNCFQVSHVILDESSSLFQYQISFSLEGSLSQLADCALTSGLFQSFIDIEAGYNFNIFTFSLIACHITFSISKSPSL